MASRLLGLLRDWVFLTAFGAGHVMDAYNVAFRLPNLVRDLFAEGAMSAAFVPTFTRELHNKGKDAAWELGRDRHHRPHRRHRRHLASPASSWPAR